ncbi:hypothetical protein B0T19DRAFT_443023 [Cercophora scortea]|uniref:Uncharacterized protein n=1 Tax=Cercophora scortea TaxID=314031 RepID=A0AAE0IEP4_9PEZI|nr:hypothetical protein B0T19DRAFT_443023 [Cercophora scortea]
MPSSSPAAAAAAKEDARLRTALEARALRFHMTVGQNKYSCVLIDRATHEKAKAERESSAKSVSTGSESS